MHGNPKDIYRKIIIKEKIATTILKEGLNGEKLEPDNPEIQDSTRKEQNTRLSGPIQGQSIFEGRFPLGGNRLGVCPSFTTWINQEPLG